MLLALLLACSGPDTEPKDTASCLEVPQEASTGMEATDGDASGYRYCWLEDANAGAFDRMDAVACTSDPRANAGECDVSSDDSECAEDADCGAGGLCGGDPWSGSRCLCHDPCMDDDDCGVSEACLCAAGVNTEAGSYISFYSTNECVPAACRTGADCPSGTCGLSFDPCAAAAGLYCRAPDDACRADADCAGYQRCAWDGAAWACVDDATCE